MAYELSNTELDKKGALEILDVSERTLANYLKDNRLGVRYEKGKTSKIAVFERVEVETLKQELNNPAKPANSVKPVKAAYSENHAKIEDRKVANMANIEAMPNLENMATLAKPELNSELLPSNFAEFAATLSAHFAAAIAETTKIQNLAVQPLLTFPEAALFTGLSERSLRQAAKAGNLIARRQGRADRILRADLDKYLTEIQK